MGIETGYREGLARFPYETIWSYRSEIQASSWKLVARSSTSSNEWPHGGGEESL
jgi:hypothetical protein